LVSAVVKNININPKIDFHLHISRYHCSTGPKWKITKLTVIDFVCSKPLIGVQ